MKMNYNFLDSSQFSCLIYPKLKNIPDSTLATLTNTKPLISAHDLHPKLRNPIITLLTNKGFLCIWGFKSTLSQLKIIKSRNIIKSSNLKKIKLSSHILDISASNNFKDALIVVLTEDSFIITNNSFEVISKFNEKFIDVRINPYYPSQISFLTESFLQLQHDSESKLSCEKYSGYEFHFSPFVFSLYNSTSVYLKDIRQPKLLPVYSATQIFQIKPIDCCYNYGILTDSTELIDCRYWKPYKKYPHITPGKRRRMFTLPLRTMMYSDGYISDTHQSLYCISDCIEKIPHSKEYPLNEIFLSLTPGCEDCGKLQPCIAEFAELYAGTPGLINDKEVWVQVCKAGGLYLESENETLSLSSISEKSRVLHKRSIASVKKFNKLPFLESLLASPIKIPKNPKPELPFLFDPVFEDFEDDN